ncbi:MAG: type II toxin-antitoxin system ParD family antitoxin [Cyclobacteriaceae bacterium]
MAFFVIEHIFSAAKEDFMNISLTPDLEKYVQAKVRSGPYQSSSEVIREALHASAYPDFYQVDEK